MEPIHWCFEEGLPFSFERGDPEPTPSTEATLQVRRIDGESPRHLEILQHSQQQLPPSPESPPRTYVTSTLPITALPIIHPYPLREPVSPITPPITAHPTIHPYSLPERVSPITPSHHSASIRPSLTSRQAPVEKHNLSSLRLLASANALGSPVTWLLGWRFGTSRPESLAFRNPEMRWGSLSIQRRGRSQGY